MRIAIHPPRRSARATPAVDREAALRVDAARLLNRATLMLSSSVLADSGIEHYRGSYHRRAMPCIWPRRPRPWPGSASMPGTC